MNPITRLQHRLSDRAHASGDAFAARADWATIKTTGRFGFGARVYHDLRFSQRQNVASKTTQPVETR